MRLDINEQNSWTALQIELSQHAIILLDGVKQKFVTCADEEQGYIERYALDSEGRIIPEGDSARIERLTGVVRIKDDRDEYKPVLSGFGCDVTGKKGDD